MEFQNRLIIIIFHNFNYHVESRTCLIIIFHNFNYHVESRTRLIIIIFHNFNYYVEFRTRVIIIIFITLIIMSNLVLDWYIISITLIIMWSSKSLDNHYFHNINYHVEFQNRLIIIIFITLIIMWSFKIAW